MPASFADLLKPEYKHAVVINGYLNEVGAAFAAVYAAALANGGSLGNITPGVDYFKKLKQAGNFKPVQGSAATVQSGETPCMVYWEYLQKTQIASKVPTYKIAIPSDATYAAYYAQAISASAPHPAAARLWEEFVYSDEGQNLFLGGSTRPIRLDALVKSGTVDKDLYGKLPAAPAGEVKYPSDDEQTAAKPLLSQQWAAAIGGLVGHCRTASGSRRPSGRREPARAWSAAPACGSWPGCCPSRPTRLSSWRVLVGAIVVGAFQDPDTGAAHAAQRRHRRDRCVPARLHHHGRAGADHGDRARRPWLNHRVHCAHRTSNVCVGWSPPRRGCSPTLVACRWRFCSS